ncbi:hypothetical protein pb186bvf_008711 [Paramecium bursaria]
MYRQTPESKEVQYPQFQQQPQVQGQYVPFDYQYPQMGQPCQPQPQIVYIQQGQPQPGMQQWNQVVHPNGPTQQPLQSRYPTIVVCHSCKKQVQTVVNHEAGTGAYVAGMIVGALGLWMGCCLIPCMINDCKDAVHFCSNCSSMVGRKKFLFE